MMKNQRRYVRISKSLEVSFRAVKGFLGSGTRNKNISESGICLPMGQYFCVGSLLKLEISSDEFKTPIKALARVVWITNQNNSKFPFEAGLEFLEILPVQWDMLRDYINRHSLEEGQQGIRWLD